MYKKYLFIFFIFLISLSGCAVRKPVPITVFEPVEGLDRETRERVQQILNTVSNKASGMSLDEQGRSTMKEAVYIMDIGPQAAPVLVERLKKIRKWKMRYWLVDMLGYIDNSNSIWPLLEIIEDPHERTEIRLKACEAIRELNYKEAAGKLRISLEIVKKIEIKEKIIETLNAIQQLP